MTARVSVVIPVYNGRETVVRALQSVQHQTVPPREVIIVDDGSRDGSADVVSNFLRDNRLLGWSLIAQVNRGPAGARHSGIEMATGTHIALLDADDEWAPEKLERSMILMHRLSLDIVGARLPRKGNTRAGGCTLLDKHAMLFRNPYFTSTVVFSRDTYFQVGGFDVSQRYAEDYKLWLAFAWRGKRAGLLDKPHAIYRPTGEARAGLSAQLWQMQRNEIRNYIWLHKCRLIDPLLLFAASAFSSAKFLRRLVIR